MSLTFHDRCLGIGCGSVVSGKQNNFVYSLFCIFRIIIVITITDISFSFVALLNCLYLNT